MATAYYHKLMQSEPWWKKGTEASLNDKDFTPVVWVAGEVNDGVGHHRQDGGPEYQDLVLCVQNVTESQKSKDKEIYSKVRWTSEKVRGAIIHKRGQKYQHDWLYLKSLNSIKHQ